MVAPELMERFEVLVVNDGSKDRTSEIAHEFAAKWPQTFVVIDKENGHYGSCVNAALGKAAGKYIKILDADDYVSSDGLANLICDLENEEADLVISDFRLVDPDGHVVSTMAFSLPTEGRFCVENIGQDIDFVYIHAIAYKRTVFAGWDYKQLEGIAYTDCQWVSEPMLRVRTVRYRPKIVTHYLTGRDGQTMSPDFRVGSIEQQMTVDLHLAKIHAKGRPKWCAQGAWDYFERLLFRELKVVYSMPVVGVYGRFPCLAAGKSFDSQLRAIDGAAWKAFPGRKEAIVTFAKIFKFNIAGLYRSPFMYVFGGRFLRGYFAVRFWLNRLGKVL